MARRPGGIRAHAAQGSLERRVRPGAVEYALIIALVSIAVIGALIVLGGKIGNIFNKIGNTLDKYPELGGGS